MLQLRQRRVTETLGWLIPTNPETCHSMWQCARERIRHHEQNGGDIAADSVLAESDLLRSEKGGWITFVTT